MTEKHGRAQYTPEFKMGAVRQVSSGQAIAVVAKVLGIPSASLGNWVRLAAHPGATATKPCWPTSGPSTPRSKASAAGHGCTRSCWPGGSEWARFAAHWRYLSPLDQLGTHLVRVGFSCCRTVCSDLHLLLSRRKLMAYKSPGFFQSVKFWISQFEESP